MLACGRGCGCLCSTVKWFLSFENQWFVFFSPHDLKQSMDEGKDARLHKVSNRLEQLCGKVLSIPSVDSDLKTVSSRLLTHCQKLHIIHCISRLIDSSDLLYESVSKCLIHAHDEQSSPRRHVQDPPSQAAVPPQGDVLPKCVECVNNPINTYRIYMFIRTKLYPITDDVLVCDKKIMTRQRYYGLDWALKKDELNQHLKLVQSSTLLCTAMRGEHTAHNSDPWRDTDVSAFRKFIDPKVGDIFRRRVVVTSNGASG